MTNNPSKSTPGPNRRTLFKLGTGVLAAPAVLTLLPPFSGAAKADITDLASHAVTPLPVPDISAIPRASVNIGEAELSYLDTGGAGEVVVFLHPASIASDCFAYQLAAFAGAGYRVIAWDRRSYGGSAGGPAESKASDASDMLALLDALGIETCHAVGLAAGGIRLADFALGHPERLNKLVFACTTLGIGEDDYAAMSAALLPEGFTKMPASFRELSATYRAANQAGAAEWQARSDAAIPGERARLGQDHKITWDGLGSIRQPVLLMTGDADLYGPPAVVALFQSHMPGAEAVIVDGAAHAVYWEQPEAFNQVVLEFLGRA